MFTEYLSQYEAFVESTWNKSPEVLIEGTLKEIRMDMGISQVEAATISEVSLELYCRWETGVEKPALTEIKPFALTKAYFDFFAKQIAISHINMAKETGSHVAALHAFYSDAEFAHYEPSIYKLLPSANLFRTLSLKACRILNSSPKEELSLLFADEHDCDAILSKILDVREAAAAKNATHIACLFNVSTDEYELYCASNMIETSTESMLQWVSLLLRSTLGDSEASQNLISGKPSKYLH